MATGGADGMLRFWDAETLEPDGDPIEFDDRIRDVAFTADGSRAVVALGRPVSADPITAASAPRVIDVAERRETGIVLGATS